jgi:Ca2+-dependent lipid-binding protein
LSSVLEGKNLQPLDKSGRCDPYVLVSLGKNKKKTKPCKKRTTDAVWNEVMLLYDYNNHVTPSYNYYQ